MILKVLYRRLKRLHRVKREWGRVDIDLDDDDLIIVSCRSKTCDESRIHIMLDDCILRVDDPNCYEDENGKIIDFTNLTNIDLNSPNSIELLDTIVTEHITNYAAKMTPQASPC